MRIVSRFLALSILLSLFSYNIFPEKYIQEQMALNRGFKHPEHMSTYGSIQLFSISDIGRSTFPILKPTSMILSRPADFEPDYEVQGSPMLKIKASGTSIDFNSFEIKKVTKYKQGNFLPYAVGIEVGYSPVELEANPNLQQIENIVIKNGGLSNFEIGIVIHAGVKNITIEDFYISQSPLGILVLGQDDNFISSCQFKKIRITGDFSDDSLILKWAKVKIEENDLSCLDSANGGRGELKGVAGSPVVGYGYGTDYPFMKLVHNPVSNQDDAYSYHGIFMKNCVNLMLENLFVKSIGYQGDRHEIVLPGQSSGSISNPVTSSVAINGPVIQDEVTPTITRGITLLDSSTIFMKYCETVDLVSALSTYGFFICDSTSVSIHNSVSSSNNCFHKNSGTVIEAITDSDVKIDTDTVDSKNGSTIFSLYSLFGNDISSLPTSNSPDIDPQIATARDLILEHRTAIDDGVGLSEIIFHVEQILDRSDQIVFRYNEMILDGDLPTSDDSNAHFQATDLIQSGKKLLKHLHLSFYSSGRKSYGFYLDGVKVVELKDLICNKNEAEHLAVGLYSASSNVLNMKAIACNHNKANDVGDHGAIPVPKAANAHAYGMVLIDSDTVSMQEVSTNFNESAGMATGLYGYGLDSCKGSAISSIGNRAVHNQLDQGSASALRFFNINSINFLSSHFNENISKQNCFGLNISCGASVDFIDLQADHNISENKDVVGLFFDRSSSLTLKNISCCSNDGELKSYGAAFDSSFGIDIDNFTADDNFVNRENKLATDSFGILLNKTEASFFKSVSASNNRGRTLGIGLYGNECKTLHIDNSDFCLNNATSPIIGENRRYNDAANASKFFSKDYISGGLGAYFLLSCDVNLSNVNASKNHAHRAAGIFALQSSDFVLANCNSSFQSAEGQYFIDDPFKIYNNDSADDISFCKIPIPLTQYPTLFGSPELENPFLAGTIVSAEHVNLVNAICMFFKSFALIPGAEGECETIKGQQMCDSNNSECVDPCSSSCSSSCQFPNLWLLIQAAMAKYRFFGTAVGLQLHDCDGFTVKNHFANGNVSEKDNAAGIACTGNNKNHLFEGDRAINNDAWTDSMYGQNLANKYDLSAVKPFYDTLYQTIGDNIEDDFDIGPGDRLIPKLSNFVSIFNSVGKPIKYFKIHLDCSCPTGSASAEDLWFTSPVGGIAAGILIGDRAENVEVRTLDCANNKGNSGAAFGLLQDLASNSYLDTNRFYQNSSNILGFCFGIADINSQSTTIMMRNFLFCNQIGNYLNFNYFVPFSGSSGLSFPVKTGYCGDFDTLLGAGMYDNIQIKFNKTALINPYVPDYIGTRNPLNPTEMSFWEENGLIGTMITTVSSQFQQNIAAISAIAPATGGLAEKMTNDIISAVLANSAGAVAINAGRDAGVAAGLLDIISISAATIADSNRLLSLAKLQEMVSQEIYTKLNNDGVLLVVQEALSVLIPRKRTRTPGMNKELARIAGVNAAFKNNLMPINVAEGVATVAVALLQELHNTSSDSAVAAARDIYAILTAVWSSTLYLENSDMDDARQALSDQGITSHSDPLIQESIEAHVAIRLKRGYSEFEATEKVIDPTRNYGTIISEFMTHYSSFSTAGLTVGRKILDGIFDFKHVLSLSGSPFKRLPEDLAIQAALAALSHLESGGTEHESILIGISQAIIRSATKSRNRLKTNIDLAAMVDPALDAYKFILINSLKDVEEYNTLLDDYRKELVALTAGMTTSSLILLRTLKFDENDAKIAGFEVEKAVEKLSSVSMPIAELMAHTIQMQIDLIADILDDAGFNKKFGSDSSCSLFDFEKANPKDLSGFNNIYGSINSKIYSGGYFSGLHYKDIAYNHDGTKIFVAAPVDSGNGFDSGLLIFSEEGLLLKKLSFGANEVHSVAAHPKKDLIVIGLDDGSVKLIDATSSNSQEWIEHPTAVLPTHTDVVEVLKFNKIGTRLVSSGKDSIVKTFETVRESPADWLEINSGNVDFDLSSVATGSVTGADWKGENILVVAHSGEDKIYFFDVFAGTRSEKSLSTDHKIQSVAFNFDGTKLYVSTDNSGTLTVAEIEIIDSSDEEIINWVTVSQIPIIGSAILKSFTTHPSKNYLAVADPENSTATANEARLRIFDLTDSDPLHWAEIFVSPIIVSVSTLGFSGLDWKPNGTRIVAGTNNSDLVLIDTSFDDSAQWTEIKRNYWQSLDIHSIACSPDGTMLATGSIDNSIMILKKDGDLQELISIIDAANFPADAHTDEVRLLSWSHDGNYLFSGGLNSELKSWNLSSGLPVLSHAVSMTDDLISIASVKNGDDDYLAISLADNSVAIVQFDHATATFLLDASIDGINNPGDEHSGIVRGLAFSSDGTKLVTASDDGNVKYWDISSTIPDANNASLIATLNGTTLGDGDDWHTGAVTAIDISADGKIIISGGADRLIFVTDLTAPTSPINLSKIESVESAVTSLSLNPDGRTLASISMDGYVRLFDITSLSHPLTKEIYHSDLTNLFTGGWCQNGYDIVFGGKYGYGIYHYLNRFGVAIAQRVYDQLPDQERAKRKGSEFAQTAEFTASEGMAAATAAYDYLIANEDDIPGAAHAVLSSFEDGKIVGNELAKAVRYVLLNYDHPVDEAVDLAKLKGFDEIIATVAAENIYKYLVKHFDDVDGGIDEAGLANRFTQAVAQVINDYGNSQAEYLVGLVYPDGNYPGLSAAVVTAGANYLTANPGDVSGASNIVADEIINQGQSVNRTFCKAVVNHIENYIQFAREFVHLSMIPKVSSGSFGGTVQYDESQQMAVSILNILKPDPTSVALQTAAEALCKQPPLILPSNNPDQSSIETEIKNYIDANDPKRTIPVLLTKKVNRMLQDCIISGVTIVNSSDSIETAAISSTIVGTLLAQKDAKVPLNLPNIDQVASMANSMLSGSLLTSGTLKNFRGDALKGVGPGGQWGSSTTTLTGPFLTLNEYFNALESDLLTGLIATTIDYSVLTSDEKEAVARAIILRTLFTGDEFATRTIFNGTVDSNYPTDIARIVHEIVTLNQLPSGSLSQLTTVARQEIAAATLIFYDQFALFGSSLELQAIASGAYLGAVAPGIFGDPGKEKLFAFIGAVGVASAIAEDKILNPLPVNQQSPFNFVAVGSTISEGFIKSYDCEDIGSINYDNLQKDLSEPVLAAIAGGILTETCAVLSEGSSKAYGKAAVLLAHNQIFGDQLSIAIAKGARDYGVLIGEAVGQFAGLTPPQSTAVAGAAIIATDLSEARILVSEQFKIETGNYPSGSDWCRGMVQNSVDILQNPVTLKLNLFSYDLFGHPGEGHPEIVGEQLSLFGGMEKINAVALAKLVYKYLSDEAGDVSGAISHCY